MKIWYSKHRTEIDTFVAGFLFFSAVICGTRGEWLSVAVNSIFIIINLKMAKWF